MKTTAKLLAAALAALLIGSPVLAAGKAKPKPATKPTPLFTQAEADAFAAEVVPVIEKLAGRKFRTKPKVILQKEPSYHGSRESSLVPIFRAIIPLCTDFDTAQAIYATMAAYRQGASALYASDRDVILMSPRNIERIAKRYKMSRADSRLFAKIILSHELTHMLHDQEIDLQKNHFPASDLDRWLAMNACVEGFATFIERRVAEELGAQRIEDRVNDVRIRYRVEDDRFPGWILGPVIESADHIYHSGADFLSWQFENGGMEGVWTATSCLPSQTRVLFHPEMYSATPAKTPDYRKAMLSLNGKFGKDWSEVVNTSAGEMVLRCALSSLPKEDVNLAVDGIEHVQMLVVAANKRRSGSVIAYIAKDRDSIDALADAIKTLETEGMKRAGFRGKTLGSRKFEGIDGAESAQKTSYQVRDVWKQTPCTRITVKKDRVLLVISVSGTQISDATTKSIANQVLLRLGRLGVFDV